MTTEDKIKMQYAGAIGLLCDLSTQITNDEDNEILDRCAQDWCDLSGWEMARGNWQTNWQLSF